MLANYDIQLRRRERVENMKKDTKREALTIETVSAPLEISLQNPLPSVMHDSLPFQYNSAVVFVDFPVGNK